MWAIKFRLANRLHCAARGAKRFQLLVILLFPQPKFIAFFLPPLYCIIGPHFHLCGASMTLRCALMNWEWASIHIQTHTHTHASDPIANFFAQWVVKSWCAICVRARAAFMAFSMRNFTARSTHCETVECGIQQHTVAGGIRCEPIDIDLEYHQTRTRFISWQEHETDVLFKKRVFLN